MIFSSFDEMQKAVDIVGTSPHPDNKIAATVFGTDASGAPFSISHTNYWPPVIAERVGVQNRIGSSSGTVHAETACILAAPYTSGASVCITDPFCPNCAKNMAEAGIRTIYIDHKGFDKDFALRRGGDFKNMSMQICERAGISVYKLYRKERKLAPILEIPETFQPPEDNPVRVLPFAAEPGRAAEAFRTLVRDRVAKMGGEAFTLALAGDREGRVFSLATRAHVARGYTTEQDSGIAEAREGKYSFIVEPVNRLLMNAPRHGLKILDGYLFSSLVPTSREQVNMVGGGVTRYYVGNETTARDDDALKALRQLSEKAIIAAEKI
jgi:dCMP deaminase